MKSRLWKYSSDEYKVYTENNSINTTIKSWKDSVEHAHYFFPQGFNTDFIVPIESKSKIIKLFKKNKEPLIIDSKIGV